MTICYKISQKWHCQKCDNLLAVVWPGLLNRGGMGEKLSTSTKGCRVGTLEFHAFSSIILSSAPPPPLPPKIKKNSQRFCTDPTAVAVQA